MPKYRFKWDNVPTPLLKTLTRDLGLDTQEDPAAALRKIYGARPTTEFIREHWPTLRDSWLRTSADSRAWVVDELSAVRHEREVPMGRDAQMDYLRSLNKAKNLLDVVWHAFVAVGEVTADDRSTDEMAPAASALDPVTHAKPPKPEIPQRERSGVKASKGKTKQPQSLEVRLWEAATALRSTMEPGEYKHIVLGLIFLKYVSDVFTVRRDELIRLVDDPGSDYFMPSPEARQSVLEDRDEYTSQGVFWIPEGHRWEDLRAKAKATDKPIGVRIDDAMDAIERENPKLRGVLPKNYSRQEVTSDMLGGLIDIFSRHDLAAQEQQDLDLLGRVYEYFLGGFAGGEGKRGGQFYTPRSVVALLVEMLQPYHGRVYDPACGSGGMFVQADKFTRAHGGARNDISVFGQESVATTWRLAKMNLALRGIDANLGNEWGDTFHDDKHPDLRADYVIANPPFNQDDWGGDRVRQDPRWKYGTPPVGNANYAWIQHMLHHLAPTGTMATVLANGSLSSQQSGEGEIRRALVLADLVECIVAMPPQLFFGTQIPVCLWFLTKNKAGVPNAHRTRDRRGETLFIDARAVGFMETRTLRAFDEADILRVADTYHSWRGTETSDGDPYTDVPGFCSVATIEEIAAQQYVLGPGRYVGSEDAVDDGEPLDEKIARLASVVRDGFKSRVRLQSEVLEVLDSLEVGDE